MIRENVLKIKERISLVCSKINQDPDSITVVAVSKGRTPEQIREVIKAGITDIGENKVQEAILKYNELTTHNSQLITIKWHMVGHLQTNKAKDAVKIFDLIHSVDSLRLAQKIDEAANKIDKVQGILIQVNTSGEASKFGLKLEETIEVIEKLVKFKNISIKGLMTITPLVDNPEKARPYFKMLREFRDRINELRVILRQAQDTSPKDTERNRSASYELRVLSMGMTDDFEVAIEESSNMIRIGRAIFEG